MFIHAFTTPLIGMSYFLYLIKTVIKLFNKSLLHESTERVGRKLIDRQFDLFSVLHLNTKKKILKCSLFFTDVRKNEHTTRFLPKI